MVWEEGAREEPLIPIGRQPQNSTYMTPSDKEFVRDCNDFLREFGCQFSGDGPGQVIEQWVAILDHNGPAPELQLLANFLAASGMELGYSDEADKAFLVLWRNLITQSYGLAAMESARASMRVFHALPKGSDVLDAARDKFLEEMLSQSSDAPPSRRGAP